MKKHRILFTLAFLTVSASSFAQQTEKNNKNTVVSTGTSRSMPNIELQFKFKDITFNSMLNIDVIEIENNKNVKKTELHNSIQTQVILKKKPNSLFLLGVNYMKDMVMINKLTLDRNTVMSKIIPKEGEKLNGNVIKRSEIETDNLGFEQTLHTVSIIYETDNIIKFKTLYNDTIFKYENQDLSVHKILHLGKYSPTRDLIENVNKKSELLSKYVQMVDVSESEQYLFVILVMNKKLNGVIIDKEDNSLVFKKEIENPKTGGGIKNDLNKYGHFWPMLSFATNSNKMAQLIHPDHLQMENIPLESNPVLQIVHLKAK